MLNISIRSKIPSVDIRKAAEVHTILELMKNYVQKRINSKFGSKLTYRCHSLCRAVVPFVPGLTIVDGLYLGLIIDQETKAATIAYADHTWYCTENGTIIDPYPVGALDIAPLVIPNESKYESYGKNLYFPDKRITAIACRRDYYQESERMKRIIKKALEEVR